MSDASRRRCVLTRPTLPTVEAYRRDVKRRTGADITVPQAVEALCSMGWDALREVHGSGVRRG